MADGEGRVGRVGGVDGAHDGVGGFALEMRGAYRGRFGIEAEILECRPSDGASIASAAELAGAGFKP
jgi:hypothetical protein